MQKRLPLLVIGVLILAGVGLFLSLLPGDYFTTQQNQSFSISPIEKNNKFAPLVIRSEVGEFSTQGGRFTSTPNYDGEIEIHDNYIIVWPLLGIGFEEGVDYMFSFSDIRLASGESVEGLEISFRVDPQGNATELQEEVLQKMDDKEQEPKEFLDVLR